MAKRKSKAVSRAPRPALRPGRRAGVRDALRGARIGRKARRESRAGGAHESRSARPRPLLALRLACRPGGARQPGARHAQGAGPRTRLRQTAGGGGAQRPGPARNSLETASRNELDAQLAARRRRCIRGSPSWCSRLHPARPRRAGSTACRVRRSRKGAPASGRPRPGQRPPQRRRGAAFGRRFRRRLGGPRAAPRPGAPESAVLAKAASGRPGRRALRQTPAIWPVPCDKL